MKYLMKKYINEIEVSELDFENDDTIFGPNEEGHQYETIEDTKSCHWLGEVIPIHIDDVINHLKNLKKQGANYVEIDYQCDHIGYNFVGLEMRKATKEEIKAEEIKNEIKKTTEKKSKIKDLEDQLANLKK